MVRRVPHAVVGATLACVVALGMLVVRVAPDVEGKPLFEDEAVTGLIATQSTWGLLETVLWERGGAPLHFLLAHAAFAFDASPGALRWMSVVFAIATVVVAFDLGRLLGGPVAGSAAALVTASSSLLLVYGSVGRMYALLACAGGVAASALVRARRSPTRRTMLILAAALWLLPATQPLGGVAALGGAVTAFFFVRPRGGRAWWTILPLAAASSVFLISDLRLASRFSAGVGGGEGTAATDPGAAWHELVLALRGFAGGEGLLLVAMLSLAALGSVVVWRRERAIVVLAAVWLVFTVALGMVVRVPDGTSLSPSPRYLIFALPVMTAFVGVGLAALVERRGKAAAALAVCVVALLALLAPRTTPDPRLDVHFWAHTGSRASLAAPAAWLKDQIGTNDVLFPYSTVFFAALPEAGRAVTLPRAQGATIRSALRDVVLPAGAVIVAVPLGSARVSESLLDAAGAGRFDVHPFGPWLLLRAPGPFATTESILKAVLCSVVEVSRHVEATSPELVQYLDVTRGAMIETVRRPAGGGRVCPG